MIHLKSLNSGGELGLNVVKLALGNITCTSGKVACLSLTLIEGADSAGSDGGDSLLVAVVSQKERSSKGVASAARASASRLTSMKAE
jgi:hypothetical protein